MVDPIRSNVPAYNVPKPRPVAVKPAAVSANPPTGVSAKPAPEVTAKPPAQQQAVSMATSAAKNDTVELSYAAHAQLLRQQGLSIPEIALKLGQDVKTVSGYFPLSIST